MSKFWRRLRFLVTDRCNYSCPFCHCEGQHVRGIDMSFGLFARIAGVISSAHEFEDVCISGGEPFCNPQVVDILRRAMELFPSVLSCASNLSLMPIEHVALIAKGKMKFNVQFPYADRLRFEASTGCGTYDLVLRHIDSLVESGIPIGLNTVLREFDEMQIADVLDFAADRKLTVKLLPDIYGGEKIWDDFRRYANRNGAMVNDKGTGATKWTFNVKGSIVNVLYVQSPCFGHDFAACKKFGEVRILPDGGLQACIGGGRVGEIDAAMPDSEILEVFNKAWKLFSQC